MHLLKLLQLNMSAVGQNLVTFTPANSTLQERDAFNPLDPFGILPTTPISILPATAVIPAFTSAVGSVAAELPSLSVPTTFPTLLPASAVIPVITSVFGSLASELPIPTGLTALNGTASTSIFGSIVSFLLGIILTSLDSTLEKAEATLVASIVEELGIRDFYSLHLMGICGGTYSNTSDSDAAPTNMSCSTYASKLSSKGTFKYYSFLFVLFAS